MPETLHILHGTKVLVCSPDGKKLRADRDAVELVGEAYGHEAQWIVIPTERLEDAFFELRTRVAGEIISRLVQYRLRVAIIGDISRHLEESSALRAFVRESNRGDEVWFLQSIDDFGGRLEARRATA
ncbi:MAG TPA: DUF4180 domain-containing protein [Candidatus Acidoferrales bacterium]|jgi:hypothetical protein|nr:DUF4180 domain-containing protein [Candidatus Acidoferrales bacterium]